MIGWEGVNAVTSAKERDEMLMGDLVLEGRRGVFVMWMCSKCGCGR